MAIRAGSTTRGQTNERMMAIAGSRPMLAVPGWPESPKLPKEPTAVASTLGKRSRFVSLA
jgi:hypothetical protein